MGLTSLQVCMDSADWLQVYIHYTTRVRESYAIFYLNVEIYFNFLWHDVSLKHFIIQNAVF